MFLSSGRGGIPNKGRRNEDKGLSPGGTDHTSVGPVNHCSAS